MQTQSPDQILKHVLELEAQCLNKLAQNISPDSSLALYQAFQKILQKKSSLFFIGVGKSGHIAKKLAATFLSLGQTSYFLHPTEALHGDLGMLQDQDLLVLISKSGTTEEILKLLPFLKNPKENIIGLLGSIDSPISNSCGIILDCSVEKEACVNNQAPTTSTTAAMAMGDAMAVLYESIVGLTSEEFAKNHPGGKLGKSLSLKVEHLMIPKEDCPIAKEEDAFIDVLLKMTDTPTGMCAILKEAQLQGIIVDGDIRRVLAKNPEALKSPIKHIINTKPIVCSPEDLAKEALTKMQERVSPISVLPVVNSKQEFLGMLRIHDIIKSGL